MDSYDRQEPRDVTVGHAGSGDASSEHAGLANQISEVASPLPGPVSISDQFWALDQRNVQVDRIASLIFATSVFAGAIVTLVIVWLNIGFTSVWLLVATILGLGVALLFLGTWLWPPLEHRYQSWRLDEEGLEIRRGVFWRHRITIPLGRVQHADVSQGPLQRFFGLGTLTVHTAGTQNAAVPLAGLAHETAIEMRDLIVRQRNDQNVV